MKRKISNFLSAYPFKDFLKSLTLLTFMILLIGFLEFVNNVLFKILSVGVFPAKLYTHFFPIWGMYVLKVIPYVGILALVYLIIGLMRKNIIGKTLNKYSIDYIVPIMLTWFLLVDYSAGPFTLTYYFYYLDSSVSTFLKPNISFNLLNFMVKFLWCGLIWTIFIIFRIRPFFKYYQTGLLLLIVFAILPALLFLLHVFQSTIIIWILVFAILAGLVSALLLLKKMFKLGIPRWLEVLLFVGFVFSIVFNIGFFVKTRNNRLNVVHIVLDTLRDKSFSNETMPFLYNLKDKGVYFPNSFSSADNTVTTHNAIYYGLYPSNVGLEHGPFLYPTIMDVLRSHDYHTTVVSANGRFCIINGFNKGVEDFYETWKDNNHVRAIDLLHDYRLSDRFTFIEKWYNNYQKNVINKPHYLDKKPMGHRMYRYFNFEPAEVVNNFVRHVLNEQNPALPFYLFINYLDPHAPYMSPDTTKIKGVVDRLKTDMPEIYSKLNFDDFPISDEFIFQQIMLMWEEVEKLQKPLKDDFLTFCYNENINYLDEQLSHLFDYFEQSGLTENTVFIITSDHGESIGEHDLYDHGNKRLYNTEIKVPLFILFPKKFEPLIKHTVVQTNTTSVDLFPTIVDILGIELDENLNGKSLLPVIFGTQQMNDSNYILSEYTGVRAITDGHYKLILRENFTELYDIKNDPKELQNLVVQYPDIVETMRNVLLRELKTKHSTAKNSHISDLDDVDRYDGETQKLLRTLGYIK